MLPSRSTSARPRRLDAAFGRDTRGSVAIEFAIVGLACAWLIVEAFQAGLYVYTFAAVNDATSRAVRKVMTGTVSQQGLTATQFRTEILCPLLPAGMTCASVVTNIQSVSEDLRPNGFYKFVNTAGTAVITPAMDNTLTTFCSGGSGTVIYAQVFYAMPVFSPAWRAVGTVSFNGAPTHLVSSAAVFKNEPFPSSTATGC
jgi:Flp pilus assembly protein TadG